MNPKNFYWSTSIIENNIVSGNYLGSTRAIKLKDEVYNGSEILLYGKVGPSVSTVYDFSKVSTVTLTGTYVDKNGVETEVNVTRDLTVEWSTGISSTLDTTEQNDSVEVSGEDMFLNFYVKSKCNSGLAILKENVVTVTAPELNGYKAIDAIVSNTENTVSEFNKETGVLTITRSGELNNYGYVNPSIQSVNQYYIKLIYPSEAHGDTNGDQSFYTQIEIPVTSTYRAYGELVNGEPRVYTSSNRGTIALMEKKGVPTRENWDAANVVIGRQGNNRRIISKDKVIKTYSNIETEPDTYNVVWNFEKNNENSTGNVTLYNTQSENIITEDGNHILTSELMTIKRISISKTGKFDEIKVYNDDTDELIKTFTMDSKEFYFEPENVKNIRVEIVNMTTGSKLSVNQEKEIDDNYIVYNYSIGEFRRFKGFNTYLSVGGTDYPSPYTYGDYAQYNELESNVTMSINNSSMQSKDKTFDETFTIVTSASEYNQIGWQNGIFLIEMPTDIIGGEIQSINISNPNVEIVGYELYKENNRYFAKIVTSNSTRALYTIRLKCNFTVNPIASTGTKEFELYAYNEDCNTYLNVTSDRYDINENENKTESIAHYTSRMTIYAPTGLITSQSVTNYDDEGSVTIAPNTANVSRNDRKADINIIALNNYDKTVSNMQILGTVPFEGNTHVVNDEPLGSQYTAEMTNEGIIVPDYLKGKVTVYYTEKENATKDLEDESNGWTQTPEDFSKVKRYLIDFGNYILNSSGTIQLSYTVKIPEEVPYNKEAFSDYAMYFNLSTDREGDLQTSAEPSKLGLRIVRKYELDITKLNAENNLKVPGAMYKVTEEDEIGNELSTKIYTSNSEGNLYVKGLFVDRIYTFEEIRNPSHYMLDTKTIKFKVTEDENGNLVFNYLSDDEFSTPLEIEDNKLTTTIKEDPRVEITVIKKDNKTDEVLKGVSFVLSSDNEIQNYSTDDNGKFILEDLDQNKEYTLSETNANGYYLLDDIEFKIVKTNGRFKIISENEEFANAELTIKANEDVIKAEVTLLNEKMPSLLIHKVDRVTKEPLKGVQFSVKDRLGSVYVTNEEGNVTINGFAENEDYEIDEIKADGYFLQNIEFRIIKDATTGKLKVESENQDFANASLIDEDRKILSIELNNDSIPTYGLKIKKVSEGTEDETLEGAKFQLISNDLNTVEEYTTDENGLINIEGLYAHVEGNSASGEYVLQETEAPAGYSNNVEQIRFRVTKKTNEEDELEFELLNSNNVTTVAKAEIVDNTLELTIEDKPLFTLRKVDSETGLPLANVSFIIKILLPFEYAKDINGEYVGELDSEGRYIVKTDEEGKISLQLPEGKYVVIEVGYQEGYEERDVIQYFQIGLGDHGNEESDADLEDPTVINVYTIEDLYNLRNTATNINNVEINLMNDLDFNEDSSYENPNNISFGDINNDGVVNGIKTELTKTGTSVWGKTDYGFRPIGRISGSFDGNNHEIKNIYANRTGFEKDGALFSYINDLKNLKVSGNITLNYKGSTFIGGIVGDVYGNVSNCSSNVNITANTLSGSYGSGLTCIGGIVGTSSNSITIEKCANYGNIILNLNYVNSSSTVSVTGISALAQRYPTIKYCYNRGNLTINSNVTSGTTYLQGAGIGASGSFIGCYNTGNIIITGRRSYPYVDNITSYSSQNVKNCYYLNTTLLQGGTNRNNGISKSSNYMKTNDFVNDLGKEYYTIDADKNDGYPIFSNGEKEYLSEINNIEDLVKLSKDVNSWEDYEGKTITLTRDLDFNDDLSYNNPNDTAFGDINENGTIEGIKAELTTGKGFLPIGEDDEASHQMSGFKGTFDGNNNKIENIYINREDGFIGLFGYAEGATFNNLGITGEIKAKNASSVASICASDNITMDNCYSKVNITAEECNYIAGLAIGSTGGNGMSLSNSYNAGNIVANSESTSGRSCIYGVGGRVKDGYNKGNITVNTKRETYAYGLGYNVSGNCYNEGNITITGENSTGMIRGLGGTVATDGTIYNKGSLTLNNCTTATVDGIGSSTVSGTAKVENEGIIEVNNCTTADVSGIGAVAGSSLQCDIRNKGAITVNDCTTAYVGGINARSSVSYAGNEADITANNCDTVYMGGIFGDYGTANSEVVCERIYNSGNIVCNNSNLAYIGGLVGVIGNSNSRYSQIIIQYSYNTGNVESIDGNLVYQGGLVGKLGNLSSGKILFSYNTGNVIGDCTDSNSFIGGVSGTAKSDNSLFHVYNTGNVKDNSSVAKVSPISCSNILEENYYLNTIEISGGSTENNGTSKTEEYMKSEDFVKDLRESIFELDSEGINNGYPVIKSGEFTQKVVEEVNNIEDLLDISEKVQQGYDFTGIEFKLTKDLDFNEDSSYRNSTGTTYGDLNGDGTTKGIKEELTDVNGKGFTPIGADYTFRGSFDGDNHEIRNIYINNSELTYVGLFGYAKNSEFKNLGITGNIKCTKGNVGSVLGWGVQVNVTNCYNKCTIDSSSTDYYQAGGVIGYCETSTIENCYNEGNLVLAAFTPGGVIGEATNGTKVNGCYNTADITFNVIADNRYYGGVIGYLNRGDADNCYNTGKINIYINTSDSISYGYFGGIAGESYGNITNSYNTGNILFNSDDFGKRVGGIVGLGSGEIENCYNTGNISTKQDKDSTAKYNFYEYLGGIIGCGGSTKIINCYNTGEINNDKYRETTDANYVYLGGLAGTAQLIENSYNTGNVVGYARQSGGIVGYIYGSSSEITYIKNCYNTGNVITSELVDNLILEEYTYYGGIIGYAGNLSITGCYNAGDIIYKLDSTNNQRIGGIAGECDNLSGAIKNSYNVGNILVKSNEDVNSRNGYIYIGGIIGQGSRADDCYNTGDINLNVQTRYLYLGGICGNSSANNCYNTGNITVTARIYYYPYINGISYGKATNCYNTGNIDISISDYYSGSGSLYYYIAGVSQNGATNSYNTGNLKLKTNRTSNDYSYHYIGGISCGNAENCYNSGNIELEDNDVIPENSNSYTYIGGISANRYISDNDTNNYNSGNIKCKSTSTYVNIGRIFAAYEEKEATINNYYLKGSTIDVDAQGYSGTPMVFGTETELEEIDMAQIESQEYYEIINQNGPWVHIDGYAPKLMLNAADQVDSVEINVKNQIKRYSITTDIDESAGIRGGSISGEDKLPYESVKYNESNTKEIIIEPDDGYEIESIKINDERITFNEDENGCYTIPAGYFANMKEDKNVVVKFAVKMLTIKKVDSDDNTKVLEGATFDIENVNSANEIFGNLTNNGNYYFEEYEGSFMPNNYSSVTSEMANSYIPIDLRNLDGEYYVTVNADCYSNTMVATTSENTDPITSSSQYSDDVFMFVNSGSTQSQNYTSNMMQGGKMYYLKLACEAWSPGAPYQNKIHSIRLFKNNNDITSDCLGELTANTTSDIKFEKTSNGKIELNVAEGTSSPGVINSYMEVDLTNKVGTYNVMLNIDADMASTLKASIRTDSNVYTNLSPYDHFMYLNSTIDNTTFVSAPLTGGNKYYLHLSCGISTSTKATNITINSVKVVKSTLEELFVNYNGTEVSKIEANQIFGKMQRNTSDTYTFEKVNGSYVNVASNPANAYIEVDLTDKEGTYNVLVDMNTLSGNGLMMANVTTDTAVLTDTSPYNKMIYFGGATDRKVYSSIPLNGGQKYYLQFKFMGGSTKSIFINKIEVVKTESVEKFNNSNTFFGNLTNNGDYYFEYNNGKVVQTNKNNESGLANSYIEVDLTNYEGRYAIGLKAESTATNSMIASVSTDSDAVTGINSNRDKSFMWVNKNSPNYGVDSDYTYMSSALEGGNKYYLKLTAQSISSEETASISDIELFKYTDEEVFKNNKGDKFEVTGITTNENGELRVSIPNIGRYIITETKAPEGYTLLNTPIVVNVKDLPNNEIVIPNKAKQRVVVHHYLKESDGTYTTIKVTDDEDLGLFDIGDYYNTAPKIDLSNLELEKTTEGEYVIPENATGTVPDGGVVVNYYYETKPIELTIKHYLDGTDQELAPEEKENYEATVNVEDDMVQSISIDQSYEVAENTNYKTLIRTYSSTLITQDDEKVRDDEIQFTNDSELVYFYAITDSTVTVKYKDIDAEDENEELLEETIMNGTIGEQYTVEVPEIENYEFYERDGELEGTYEAEPKVVILYYKRKANVKVNHIDNDDSHILETENYPGKVGDRLTTSEKSFEHYVLVQRPENETVVMTAEEIELNYYYKKIVVDVVEKHIDDVTEDVLYEETHSGVEGEEYEIESKEFTGYDLVEDKLPENASGTRGSEDIEVVYYYKKQAEVLVQYIDSATEEPIPNEDITIKGHENDPYETEAKEIENYDLDETRLPDNAEGTMAVTVTTNETGNKVFENQTVVKYYYKYKSKVIERHYDNKTEELIEDETVTTGHEGDEYSISSKEFERYVLNEDRLPQNAEGAMTKEDIIVNYYYKYVSTVTTKYLDEDDKDIIPSETEELFEGETYKPESKEIEGYELDKERLPAEDGIETEIGKEDKEIIYYYKKIVEVGDSLVTENHIDVMDNNILATRTYTGKVGDEYVTSAKTFEKYDLVEDRLPDNAAGTMTEEEIVVNYYYKYRATITTRFVDEETGKDIGEPEEQEVPEGDSYTTTSKEIEGYDLDESKLPENANGEAPKSDVEVIYYYKKKETPIVPKEDAKVIAKYVDVITNKELDSKVYTGKVGDSYKTESKKIEKYDLVGIPDNEKGTMTKEDIIVTYYYKYRVTRTVRYVDIETDKDLVDKEVIEVHEGDKYTSTAKEIKGYKLVVKPENAEGTMTKEDEEIIYYYLKETEPEIIEKITEKTVEVEKPVTNTIIKTVKTGDNIIKLAIILVSSVVAIIVTAIKRKNK